MEEVVSIIEAVLLVAGIIKFINDCLKGKQESREKPQIIINVANSPNTQVNVSTDNSTSTASKGRRISKPQSH